MEKKEDFLQGPTRRGFLRTVGIGVPTLAIMVQGDSVAGHPRAELTARTAAAKFTAVDLTPYFNTSARGFGPRGAAKSIGKESARDSLIRVPTGKQIFQGIPFSLGPDNVESKAWIALSSASRSWATRSVEVPLNQKATFACLAAFCDWDENENPAPGEDVMEKVGQLLAEVEMTFDNGEKTSLPLRRRFEVNAPRILWGHLCFNALPDQKWGPAQLNSPLPTAADWGYLQTRLQAGASSYPTTAGAGTLWISALANPQPDRVLKGLRLEAASEDAIIVCGLTLFHGDAHPLRQQKLSLYRLTLPTTAVEKDRWDVGVDLGIVARTFVLPEFDPAHCAPPIAVSTGESLGTPQRGNYLYVELTASPDATLILNDMNTGQQYEFSLAKTTQGGEIEASPTGARVEVLEREKCWVHSEIVDAATGKPTPVRLSFRSADGRYIPPYGHAQDINPYWFQDYGADLQVRENSFAYVEGNFNVELPVGDVYVEVTKGFEYQPVRKKLQIQAGQNQLQIEIPRMDDLRSRGWVTADTHVHFLSPSTAVLEGQAEGLNLIHLLASQWGDLFTNVGDLPQGNLSSEDGEMQVCMGTENRQHILGHMGLLGGKGPFDYHMCSGGPSESFLGDPVWSSMADWASICRKREGLVVAAHFPYPTSEIAADIAMEKIDAIELRPTFSEHFNGLNILDWYRYLNCGYRLPVVGGTDKMGGTMPVGGERTYAYLGQEPLNFANWAKAVRRGNTFMTSGPLLILQVDGHAPGDEITLNSTGASVEVEVELKSIVPINYLQVILNGKIVASRESQEGTREINLKEKISVPGSGWLAVRCSARQIAATGQWPTQVCAHTSPVYFKLSGQDLFSASTASYMLTLIEGSLIWIDNLAIRPDANRFDNLRKVFLDASERIHRRLHDHGIEH